MNFTNALFQYPLITRLKQTHRTFETWTCFSPCFKHNSTEHLNRYQYLNGIATWYMPHESVPVEQGVEFCYVQGKLGAHLVSGLETSNQYYHS